MAKQRIKVCIDRVVPDALQPGRAMLERALRQGGSVTEKKLAAGDFVPRPRMAIPQLKMWPNGTELKCRFLDGSTTQRKKVEAKAHLWEQFANITFKVVSGGSADVRISFSADPGSWSALGTDALNASYFPAHQPTMNYGWLEDDTDDTEYNRVVVHEFGHVLGAIHEHQQPAAKLPWNKDEVYRTFSGPPNYWSKDEIDSNVLERYAKEHMNYTAFDPKSIMLYHFPAELFLHGDGTPNNTDMSAQDEDFIAKMYPKGK